MSVLGGLTGAWLRQRSSTRRVVAWALAVAGPALLTLAALQLRSSPLLGGYLFSALLVVIAAAVVGGTWPALTSVVLTVPARVIFFAPPFADQGAGLQPNPISLVTFTVVGAAVSVLIGRLAQLAGEQAALRRVATLVAHAVPAAELFAAVTEEVGRLVPADLVGMARYGPGDALTSVAGWSRAVGHFPAGSRWPLAGELAMAVSRTGRPAQMSKITGDAGPLAAPARRHGIRSAAAVPIMVDSRIWGVLLTGSGCRRAPPPGTEARLVSFTDLLAAAISTAGSRAGLTRLAEEQAALRRVATLVARAAPPDEVFTAVTQEAGQLLETAQTAMIRYGSDGTSTVVASWRRTGKAVPPVGDRQRLGGKNLTTIISQTCRPARLDSYADAFGAPAAAAREAGFRSAAGAPIIVQSHLWGAMIASSVDEHPLPPDTEERLASFSRPVAIMLMGVLAHIGNPAEHDDRVAQSVVGTLKAALPSGGYLAIYDSSDVDPGLNDALHKYNESGAAPYRVRRPDQITRYFDGLDLVDPGVVPIQQWRPDHSPFDHPEKLTNFGGVARKVLCRLAPGVSMDLPEIQGSQAGWGLGYEQAGPMAVRMLLGTRLRKLRESAGVSREDAGYAIRGSESKISRMELGRTSPKLRDVGDLLELYGVSEDERATLLAMAGHANTPGWWQAYSNGHRGAPASRHGGHTPPDPARDLNQCMPHAVPTLAHSC